MKKAKLTLASVLSLSVMLAAAACAPQSEGQGGGGQGGGDTYTDLTQNKQPGGDNFDFDGNYENPELTIDGLGNDEQWKDATTLTTYGNTAGGKDAVTVRVYRGESALFFLFEVSDSVLLTQGVTNDDAVTHGDSIELYLDTLADGGRTPQSDDYQINLGIHGKTRIMQGAGGQWGSWNGLIDYEVALNGTLNDGDEATDTGYSVEVMIPYAQIMIEKDDTIGIAFGQVDKVRTEDAATGSLEGPWNWYGWTYKGTAVNPQVPDQYILLDKDDTLVSRDEQVKAPADLAGIVKDTDGTPVEGVTVTAQSDEVVKTARTDAAGYYVLADLDPERTYTVTAEKEGYLDGIFTCTREELRAADGGVVMKDVTLTALEGLETTTLTGTVKNILNGAVSGATISVDGMALSAQSGQDGAFSLEGVPASVGDITLVISGQGYDDGKLTVAQEDLEADGTTALGDVNISLPAAETGAFGVVNLLANNSGYISRTLEGVEFRFEGERTFNGWIELFIDTKESGDTRGATDAMYSLKADGTVSVTNYGGSFTTEGIEWTVNAIDGGGYTARLLIPYETLGIGALEPFGISLGQSNGQGVWDGWGRDDMKGANGEGFVKPEMPADYVRVGADNRLYEASHNDLVVALGGTVTDGEGTPVAGVSVQVGEQTATTDGEGKWQMSVAFAGDTLTVRYSKQGYVAAQDVVNKSDVGTGNSWNGTKQLSEKLVTVTGTVTDQDEDPIEGVTVTLTYAGGERRTATTNGEGVYTFTDVTTFVGVTITFTKEGYADGSETRTAQQLAAADKLTVDKNITATSQVVNVTLGGKVIGVEGTGLKGAVITAGDWTATPGEDGSFTIENFPVVDTEITVTLNGYLSAEVSFTASDYTEGETFSLGDIYLAREYTQLGGAFGTKADAFASFTPYVTRGETAFLFRFVGERAFTGTVELYLDTGLSSGDGGRNATDYRFDLRADGSIGVDNFGGTNTGTGTLVYAVSGSAQAPVLTLEIPYAFLGVQRDEIVGVTFGQGGVKNGDVASDWDGWNGLAGVTGVNGLEFVQPERTWDYIRIGVDNKPFWNAENVTLEELDLTDYNLHFGKGAKDDSIHAKVSRDETGLTFEFITLGDFSSRSEGTETILIYIDTGTPAAGWQVDHQYKLVSDGTVYKNLDSDDANRADGNAWWAADDAHKLGTFTISRENGVTRMTYKVMFTDIGVSADEVFGFTLVEGWLTGDNGSNEYAGCLYSYADGCHVVADAANTAGYIRVKADGSLVAAASNEAAE